MVRARSQDMARCGPQQRARVRARAPRARRPRAPPAETEPFPGDEGPAEREQWRRVLADERKLAKRTSNDELGPASSLRPRLRSRADDARIRRPRNGNARVRETHTCGASSRAGRRWRGGARSPAAIPGTRRRIPDRPRGAARATSGSSRALSESAMCTSTARPGSRTLLGAAGSRASSSSSASSRAVAAGSSP